MSTENVTRIKKAKGKVVTSRYLQSAEKYSSDGASSGRTKIQALKKNETVVDKNTKTISNRNRFSTPENNAPLPAFDASSIANTTCFFGTKRKDCLKQVSLSSTGVKPKKQSNNMFTNAPVIHKKKKLDQIVENKKTKDLEVEIDICYSRYLLAVLLENKAKAALKTKSCSALEKFYEVYQYVGLLLKRHENLEKGLNIATYLLKVHEHLQKQEKTLSPILESIPSFEAQYEEIADAVDSVRHKLYMKDIDLPEDGYQGEIIQLMERVITLLEQILQITNNTEEIVSTADAAKKFVLKGKAIAEEIKRASEQLSESRDLLISETSLKFASLTMEND